MSSNDWVIVLAAGEGARIGALTTDGRGVTIPKQYWAPKGGRPMLSWTLERAGKLAPHDRIITVVAAQHQRWWRPLLGAIPAPSVVVQPRNRGTAAGILLPLLHVLARDRYAAVAILPSDHYVADESTIVRGMTRGLELLRRGTEIVLLGITPDGPDQEYGWVLCDGEDGDGTRRVVSFFEKPGPDLARRLHRSGALWSSFMLAAHGRSLLSLFGVTLPDLLERFLASMREERWTPEELDRLYDELPHHDFSRDVLQRGAGRLRMLEIPSCGWSDLGTPRRLTEWLAATTG